MAVESPTLYPEPREAMAPPARGRHGYYRKADGWIVVASTTPSNRADYEYKGHTFLARYGEFVNGTGEPRAAALERDAKGNPWNPAMEPWRLIFQLGGAKEFPIDQIIAYRWHIRPPYREVTFPQLEGVEITDYFCPECDRGVFSSPNPAEAARQLRIHLTSGISDSHRYSASDLKALGDDWGIDFETARMGRKPVKREAVKSLDSEEEAVPTLTPVNEKEYICAVCGFVPQGKAPWLALRNHKCK